MKVNTGFLAFFVSGLAACGSEVKPRPVAVPTAGVSGPAAVAGPLAVSAPPPAVAAPAPLATTGTDVALVKVTNSTNEKRASETLAIGLAEIRKFWAAPSQVVLLDPAGNQVLSQLVDTDGDESPDELVFQTDLAAGETKVFSLRFGKRAAPSRDQFKVYGRFVRERHDDFAWENDRIARRMYGPELETFRREPLTSSGIDVWVKRTAKLVVNDWYMTNDYHHDHGEGADFYSVGKSRGCGGLGVWSNDKLYVSRNFTGSRVLANGPVRLIFELSYAPFDAGGRRVSETKRVTLDAGKNFEKFESTFKADGNPQNLSVGIGIAKHKGSDVQVDPNVTWMRTWEPISDKDGHLGCGVILPNNTHATHKLTETDYLLVAEAVTGKPLVYYTGLGWDKSGEIADVAAFTGKVQSVAREVTTPAKWSISAGKDAKPWSARTCETMIERRPEVFKGTWAYDIGLVLMGCQLAAEKHHYPQFTEFAKKTVGELIKDDGSIRDYKLEDYNIDNMNMGKVLFSVLQETKDQAEKQRLEKALRLLRSQMKTHPRTKEGGFWHKKIYPNQMWLDGAYMAGPFLAKYALVFNEPALLDEVAHELIILERHTRDPKTGLLYHGWDESRAQKWANAKTGTSPSFWGRAMGWYAMALVDVIELMPKTHPQRGALLAILNRLATAIASTQDAEAGVWWQVLDAPKREKNYLEASASSMFVYALSKAIRNGSLDSQKYLKVAEQGYRGILQKFVEVDETGGLSLKNVCKVAGLGGTPYRDGTYQYYTSTEVVANDPKGVGAFILASLERE